MLHFSKQEDYAIILLNVLTQNYNKKLTPLSLVSKEYGISSLFLRNLASSLSKAGIIKAKEGKNGGYFLTRHPKELKVGEVLGVFSKKPILECCSFLKNKNLEKKCPKEKICKVSSSWKKINVEFLGKVYNLTLYDFFQL
ncbi:MAG: Rrf2 family transcriptional regulator [Candidatus Levybacteria bacterium]|nr:Rrf2 family transcriptional regulator [Candidatus Levybacteria bacterium]